VSLPDLGSKCRNLFLFWKNRLTVGPETLMMALSKVGQTPAGVATVR
jgi:hypothetical protein